ncbi:MAG: nitroreductase [Clostridia bacterium]|nr:nitroreductase [Clostridia bacterium]
MNEIYEAALKRRSIKKYKPDAVDIELIKRICTAGIYAANGRNFQSPIVLAVTDKALRDRLSALNAKFLGKEDFDPFYGAPVVLVVLADKQYPTYLYDGSLTMGNMMLAAYELGLGSCWIHRAKEVFECDEGKAILRECGIEGDYEGIGNCIIGYADIETPDAPPRKGQRIFYV